MTVFEFLVVLLLIADVFAQFLRWREERQKTQLQRHSTQELEAVADTLDRLERNVALVVVNTHPERNRD